MAFCAANGESERKNHSARRSFVVVDTERNRHEDIFARHVRCNF